MARERPDSGRQWAGAVFGLMREVRGADESAVCPSDANSAVCSVRGVVSVHLGSDPPFGASRKPGAEALAHIRNRWRALPRGEYQNICSNARSRNEAPGKLDVGRVARLDHGPRSRRLSHGNAIGFTGRAGTRRRRPARPAVAHR